MIWFFRFLFGYVKFEFTNGFSEKFINDCFKNANEITKIEMSDNGFTAFCRASVYKKLHKSARLSGGKTKIIKKSGLPFILKPLKNRAGFLLGAVIFIFIISFLGAFVWNVEITGTQVVSENTLKTYLENNNLKCGVMWSAVNRKSIAWDIMSDFDSISWAHINKNGTTAVVEINETTPTPAPADQNKLAGVKAIRKEITSTASRTQSKISINGEKKYITLCFFGIKIPLYFNISQGDVEETEEKALTVKGVKLPIGVIVKSEKYLTSQKYDLTDKELEKLALKKLSIRAKKELDNYEIINSSVSCQTESDACTATGAYIVRYKEE